MDDTGSLKQSVRSAVGWATATRFVAQMANWAMTLVTVRFLRPEDYGLMAVTVAITGFLQPLSYNGLATAIVHDRRIGDDDLRSVFGLILLINLVFLVVLCLAAYPVAWLYDEPRLIALLQCSSLYFIANALQMIPRVTLEKRLDMKTVSRVELASNVLGGALVLGLAWAGEGVWSLLFGMLFTVALRVIGFGLAAPYFRRPRLALRSLSRLLQFGGLRTAEGLLVTFYWSADVFIIGKFLGPDILGIYSISRYVAALPVEKLGLVVNPIVLPAFAQVQDEPAEALWYLVKAMRILGFLCFPVLLGVAATAPQIVAAVLGPKWSQAATPLAILAIAMTMRAIVFIIPSFLAGLGEFAASFKNAVFATFLFPAAFIVGSYWGLLGVCAAWLVAYPIQLASLLRRVALVSQTSIFSLAAPLLPPFVGSLIMYGAVRVTAAILPAAAGRWSTLASLVAVGVLVYIGYAALFLRPVAAELKALVRR